MQLCMRICECAVCVYLCLSVCVYVRICECVYVCSKKTLHKLEGLCILCLCLYLSINVCLCVCLYVWMSVCSVCSKKKLHKVKSWLKTSIGPHLKLDCWQEINLLCLNGLIVFKYQHGSVSSTFYKQLYACRSQMCKKIVKSSTSFCTFENYKLKGCL